MVTVGVATVGAVNAYMVALKFAVKRLLALVLAIMVFAVRILVDLMSVHMVAMALVVSGVSDIAFVVIKEAVTVLLNVNMVVAKVCRGGSIFYVGINDDAGDVFSSIPMECLVALGVHISALRVFFGCVRSDGRGF